VGKSSDDRVPIDILLYWTFSYPFDRELIRTPRLPLTEHPYRIELPDHGNIGRNYFTRMGTERLEISEFLAELGNPSYLRNFESLRFRASMELNGKQHSRDYTAAPIIWPGPPPSQVEIDAQWIENRLRAGERATLKITVKNTDETVLMGFTMITKSTVAYFDNWKLTFGDIVKEASETRGLGFWITPETPAKDVDVSLRFKTASGFVHPEIDLMLHITE